MTTDELAAQIAEQIIRGYQTDSGIVLGIRWSQVPALRTLLVEAAKEGLEHEQAS